MGYIPSLKLPGSHLARLYHALFDAITQVEDPAMLDLTRIRSAQLTGCAVELSLVPQNDLRQVLDWQSEDSLNTRQKAWLHLTDQLLVSAAKVSNELVDDVAQYLSAPEIFAATFASGLYESAHRYQLATGQSSWQQLPGIKDVWLHLSRNIECTIDPARPSRIPFPKGSLTAIMGRPDVFGDYHLPLKYAFWRFYGLLWSDEKRSLDVASFELVRLKSVMTIECGGCSDARYRPARDAGVTEAMVRSLDQPGSDVFVEHHRCLLEYVAKFLGYPVQCGNARKALAQHYPQQEIDDIDLLMMGAITGTKITTALIPEQGSETREYDHNPLVEAFGES